MATKSKRKFEGESMTGKDNECGQYTSTTA